MDSPRKLHHLAGHDAGESINSGDPIAHFDHPAHLADVDLGLELLNFLLDNGSDLVGFEFHGRSCQSFAGVVFSSWLAIEAS